MTFKRFMALTAMAFLWTGSQIPVYLYGGISPYIYGDIGGTNRWVWFALGQPPLFGRCLSVCWKFVRSPGSSIRRTVGWLVSRTWHDYLWDGSHDEHIHW